MKKSLAVAIFAILFILAACKNSAEVTQTSTLMPPSSPSLEKQDKKEVADNELVVIKDYIPDIFVDLRYATENNFTGKVIYKDDVAYLRYGTVKKLMKVQEKLRQNGMSLLIWDAYRPKEAQFKLWEICPNPTFVANPNKGFSDHSRGNTVDISITDDKGNPLEMPSEFDEFGKKADRQYDDVSAGAKENSILLETIMTECGFKGYNGEWWHYTDVTEYPVIEK